MANYNSAYTGAQIDAAITAVVNKANDDAVVHNTGDETVAGVKTFSSFPITPSSAPTANYQVANRKYVVDNKYTHPTTAGNKHIPSGGSTGQYLKYSASGTAVWADVASGGAQIAVGSYTGTNTYGVDNPNTLTFPSPPKLVIISVHLDSSQFALFLSPCVQGWGRYTTTPTLLMATWNGNTLSWYNTVAPYAQLNTPNQYNYIALL